MRHRKPLKRKTSLKPKIANPRKTRTRKASEFARVYGSRERAAWVAAQPCIICGLSPVDGCDNAHTPTRSGMGKKGPYTAIIPLCRHCHTRQHMQGWAAIGLGDADARALAAYFTEVGWQRRRARGY